MKNILNVILVAVFILAGSAAGYMLKSPSAAPANSDMLDDASAGEEDAASKSSDKDAKGKKDKGQKEDAGTGENEYYKFTREFVVPLMTDERVDSLVIVNINLETSGGLSQSLYSIEPKLRDNIMSTLIELSNDGVTLHQPTSVESYETIRSMVKKNLHSVVASGIENVLIVDLAKQKV